jgi:hypothetical protein
MEQELISQREYYLLGVDIYKTLTLDKVHRPVPAKEYLEKMYSNYCKLMESSNAVARKLDDKLMPVSPSLELIKPTLTRSPLSRSISMEMEQSISGGV